MSFQMSFPIPPAQPVEVPNEYILYLSDGTLYNMTVKHISHKETLVCSVVTRNATTTILNGGNVPVSSIEWEENPLQTYGITKNGSEYVGSTLEDFRRSNLKAFTRFDFACFQV